MKVGEKIIPSNISASWTANGLEEMLIGGVLQGRKQFDVRGASRMCKRRMWKLAMDTAMLVGIPAVQKVLSVRTYGDVKAGGLLQGRRKVKDDVRRLALQGWAANGCEDFEIRDVH